MTFESILDRVTIAITSLYLPKTQINIKNKIVLVDPLSSYP
uniref:Uncharacterized protein n=1 Tax=Lepeophtheirus salmonis TaxID=72036 RepID=A0A0K2UVW0_LEPSM